MEEMTPASEVSVTNESSAPVEAHTATEIAPPEQSTGLFSNSPQQATEEAPTVVENEEWYLSEGVKGEGPVPEHFLKDKYKTVNDHLKAIDGMRKKLSSFTGAPEGDYELTADQNLRDAGIEELKIHDGFEKDIMVAFKEAGMNNEYVNKIANAWALATHKTQEQDKLLLNNYDKEQRNLLTKNKIDTEVVATYLRNHAEPEIAEAFLKQNTMDATTVLLLDSLRQSNTYKQPDNANPAPQRQMTAEDLRAKLKEAADSHDVEKMNVVKDLYIKAFGG